MNHDMKMEIIREANRRRIGISDEKSIEYASGDDVLANFKRQGERWNVETLQAAGIYFGKHIDSIETFVKEMSRSEGLTERLRLVNRGEGIQSRLDDARNYLDLIECLLAEEGLLPYPEIDF